MLTLKVEITFSQASVREGNCSEALCVRKQGCSPLVNLLVVIVSSDQHLIGWTIARFHNTPVFTKVTGPKC